MNEKALREKNASNWAQEALERDMRLLCAEFGQAEPVVIEPNDDLVLQRSARGIAPEVVPFGWSCVWRTTRDVDWSRYAIEYFDKRTGRSRTRLPHSLERFELLETWNRCAVEGVADLIWASQLRAAATALACDVAGIDPPPEVQPEPIDLERGRRDEPLPRAPLGPYLDRASRVVRAYGGTIELSTNCVGLGRLAFAAGDVEVCLAAFGHLDGYDVRVRQWSMEGSWWLEEEPTTMMEVKAAPRVVLRPKPGGRFTATPRQEGGFGLSI